MLTGEVTVALFAGEQIVTVRFTPLPAQVPPVEPPLSWMFSVVVAPWVTWLLPWRSSFRSPTRSRYSCPPRLRATV